MGYTKNRVTITAEIQQTDHNWIDGIVGVVKNEKGVGLSNVEVHLSDLYGTYKETVTTDNDGKFNTKHINNMNYNPDFYWKTHEYLFKIEYYGDAENFGAVKTIPANICSNEDIKYKIVIENPKKEYMPGEEIIINVTDDDSRKLTNVPFKVECEFNRTKSVLNGRLPLKFTVPDVNVDNLKCKLNLQAISWSREGSRPRLEMTFDIIVVKKIKLTTDGKRVYATFYNVDGTPKKNWHIPYNFQVYRGWKDKDEEKYFHQYVQFIENEEYEVDPDGIDGYNLDYIYVIYRGVVSNTMYRNSKGEWTDVKEL